MNFGGCTVRLTKVVGMDRRGNQFFTEHENNAKAWVPELGAQTPKRHKICKDYEILMKIIRECKIVEISCQKTFEATSTPR